jgi:hypothetical protein
VYIGGIHDKDITDDVGAEISVIVGADEGTEIVIKPCNRVI